MVKQHLVMELLCYIKPKALSSPQTDGVENLARSLLSPHTPSLGSCSCQPGPTPAHPGQNFPRVSQWQGSQ